MAVSLPAPVCRPGLPALFAITHVSQWDMWRSQHRITCGRQKAGDFRKARHFAAVSCFVQLAAAPCPTPAIVISVSPSWLHRRTLLLTKLPPEKLPLCQPRS